MTEHTARVLDALAMSTIPLGALGLLAVALDWVH